MASPRGNETETMVEQELVNYARSCPVKQSQALLRSILARDNRTWAEEPPQRPGQQFFARRGVLLPSHAW